MALFNLQRKQRWPEENSHNVAAWRNAIFGMARQQGGRAKRQDWRWQPPGESRPAALLAFSVAWRFFNGQQN